MATSKKGAFKSAPTADAAHSHDELNAKIASLEKKVVDLESKLAGVLNSVNTLSEVKNELEEAKAKLGSEVKELKENAKSWMTKQKESIDTNGDGKIDMEEIYKYVSHRMGRRR